MDGLTDQGMCQWDIVNISFAFPRKPRKKKRTYAMSCLVRSRSAVRRARSSFFLFPDNTLALSISAELCRRTKGLRGRAVGTCCCCCCCWLGGRAPPPLPSSPSPLPLELLPRSFRKPKPLRVTESVCESTRIKPRKRSERSEHRWDIRGERGSDGVFVRELQERERHFFRKAVLLTALAAHH